MTIYSEELTDRICQAIAQGISVTKICQADDMPHHNTVYGWLITYPEFLAKYDIAKEKQMEVYANQIIDLADECSRDSDAVAKAKLQIFARQWVMGKLKPKKYGERTVIAGDKDNPLTLNIASTLDQRLADYATRKSLTQQNKEEDDSRIIDGESVEIE